MEQQHVSGEYDLSGYECENFDNVSSEQADLVASLLDSHMPDGMNRYFIDSYCKYDEEARILAVAVVPRPDLHEPAIDIVHRLVNSARMYSSDNHAA